MIREELNDFAENISDKTSAGEGGIAVAEIETLQIIDKACETVFINITTFRNNMLEQPTKRCYDRAFDIFCAEQIAYYFTDHVGGRLLDNEKLRLFTDEQLTMLAKLNSSGLTAAVLVEWVMNNDTIRISNSEEVEESVKDALDWLCNLEKQYEGTDLSNIGNVDILLWT